MSEYGVVTVGVDNVSVRAERPQLVDWADRPHASWPDSTLRLLNWITVDFDETGMVDLDYFPRPELDTVELSAWAADVVGEHLAESHPCWFVVVGQFRGA